LFNGNQTKKLPERVVLIDLAIGIIFIKAGAGYLVASNL